VHAQHKATPRALGGGGGGLREPGYESDPHLKV
jgi:hypothetical protein